MPAYTLRRTGLSSNPDDYVFSCNGLEVGRCYLRTLSDNRQQWSWTIYIGIHVKRIVEGVPIAGTADTLDEAKTAFRKSFDRMIAAGVVSLD
jgi:hypothetical protein